MKTNNTMKLKKYRRLCGSSLDRFFLLSLEGVECVGNVAREISELAGFAFGNVVAISRIFQI